MSRGVVDPGREGQPAGGGPGRASGPADERELFIEYAIRLTKNRLKVVDLMRSVLLLLAFVAGYITLFVVLDHATNGLGDLARRVLVGLFLAGSALIFGWSILVPLLRRINDLYAARLIERANPQIKNSLIAAIQLNDHHELPGPVLSAIKARAVQQVAAVNVDSTVDVAAVGRWAAVLGTILAGFIALMVLSNKSALVSAARAVGVNVPAPTATRLFGIGPQGDAAWVLQDDSVAVEAFTGGAQPAKATVWISRDGGKNWPIDERYELGQIGQDEQGHPHWSRKVAVPQTLLFRVQAGDAVSEWSPITAVPPPRADVHLRVEPPEYTGDPILDPLTKLNVTVVEGTRLTVVAETNVEAGNPRLGQAAPRMMLVGGGAKSAGSLELDKADTAGRRWERPFDKLAVGGDLEFYVRFADRFGHENKDPLHYQIHVKPDNPPKLVIVNKPARLMEGELLRLRGECSDDYGLSKVVVRFGPASPAGEGGAALAGGTVAGQLREIVLAKWDWAKDAKGDPSAGAQQPAQPLTWSINRDFDVQREFGLAVGTPPIQVRVTVYDNRLPVPQTAEDKWSLEVFAQQPQGDQVAQAPPVLRAGPSPAPGAGPSSARPIQSPPARPRAIWMRPRSCRASKATTSRATRRTKTRSPPRLRRRRRTIRTRSRGRTRPTPISRRRTRFRRPTCTNWSRSPRPTSPTPPARRAATSQARRATPSPATRRGISRATRPGINPASNQAISKVIRPGLNRVNNPATNRATRPEPSPATRAGISQASKAGISQAIRLATNPVTKPAISRASKAATNLGNKAAINPAIRAEINLVTKPGTSRVSRVAINPVSNPVISRVNKVATSPVSKGATNLVRRAGISRATKLVATNRAIRPETKAEINRGTKGATNPAIRRAISQATKPATNRATMGAMVNSPVKTRAKVKGKARAKDKVKGKAKVRGKGRVRDRGKVRGKGRVRDKGRAKVKGKVRGRGKDKVKVKARGRDSRGIKGRGRA